MRLISFVLLALISCSGFSEEKKKLYKWVDEQGNVHYSDEPHKGAKEVKLPEVTTIKMKAPQMKPLDSSQIGADSSKSPIYDEVALISPENDGVIRNNAAQVTLVAKISPAIEEGHKLQFTLDGQTVANPENASTVIAENIEYGLHTANVAVVDDKGKQIKSGKPINFALLHFINPNKRKNNN